MLITICHYILYILPFLVESLALSPTGMPASWRQEPSLFVYQPCASVKSALKYRWPGQYLLQEKEDSSFSPGSGTKSVGTELRVVLTKRTCFQPSPHTAALTYGRGKVYLQPCTQVQVLHPLTVSLQKGKSCLYGWKDSAGWALNCEWARTVYEKAPCCCVYILFCFLRPEEH